MGNRFKNQKIKNEKYFKKQKIKKPMIEDPQFGCKLPEPEGDPTWTPGWAQNRSKIDSKSH